MKESVRMTEDRDKCMSMCGQPSDLGRLKNRKSFSCFELPVDLYLTSEKTNVLLMFEEEHHNIIASRDKAFTLTTV